MAITPLPTPPSRDDPTNFATRADAFLGALPTFATEANALAVAADADALAASNSASAASAAAIAATAAANTTKWVSGTTYAEGVVTWSPITFYSYRRKIAGAGTTDPSADSTNWGLVAGDVTQAGSQTLTNKTIALGSNSVTGTKAQFDAALTDGDFATLAGSETLTNKTIALGSNSVTGTKAQFDAALTDGDFATLDGSETLTNKTLTSPALNSATASGITLNDGYTEEIFAISGTTPALSPNNGSIQTWTLTGNSTPTLGTWADGQSMTLSIDDGTAFTITWTSLGVNWKTGLGVAPTLNLTTRTMIVLWEIGGVVYGARVGDA